MAVIRRHDRPSTRVRLWWMIAAAVVSISLAFRWLSSGLDPFAFNGTDERPPQSVVEIVLGEFTSASGSTLDNERHIASGVIARSPDIIPTRQRRDGGAFVHIGKTGGSTLSALLRNACHSWMPHPCRNVTDETIASKLIESYYHVPDFGLLPQSHHDFYLLSIRDPFDRAVSSFVFEHALNRKARKDPFTPARRIPEMEAAFACFPTLESYVQYLEGDSTDFDWPYHRSEVPAESCRDLARASFHGKVRPFNHFYFNYQRIKSLLPAPDLQKTYVIRQEFLWKDWVSVNAALGQTEGVKIPEERNQIRNHSHMILPVSKDLSSRGVSTLCDALQEEYDSYVWFLRKAINLDPVDVAEAISQIKQRCPHVQIR